MREVKSPRSSALFYSVCARRVRDSQTTDCASAPRSQLHHRRALYPAPVHPPAGQFSCHLVASVSVPGLQLALGSCRTHACSNLLARFENTEPRSAADRHATAVRQCRVVIKNHLSTSLPPSPPPNHTLHGLWMQRSCSQVSHRPCGGWPVWLRRVHLGRLLLCRVRHCAGSAQLL